ncbi:MAG: Hpt domain-containing protein [Calditrichia bacterium]|nr:Hpt domain-containing protein [Calditrichota bacterium]MCB0268361.1 Hpt domain-containing protein [Calditrichota bacterium]MCB0285672.1 Hpt domain-containing protein [Calditrichota bacterium]MCB9066715.1 Hpt domain-containing protein [Calditrichia bacterium]
MELNNVLNREELFARVDDDVELLGELIELFLEDYPDLITEIEKAIQQKDAIALKKAAHTLKGAVGNFCAEGAFEASRKLEAIGAQGNLETVAADFQQLQQEMQNVTKALQEISREYCQ